ncbi:unnamed protein product [Trifolium pratense]|uniref:Uncharacterized protein n=1 Tax=Trifolium pratense TaxID=57577 RepID=A0ACB0IRG8_TRIPR|nr:unnamed protein product [Trifolium pratense]
MSFFNLDNFEFGNILPCTNFKEGWSTIFDGKYPHARFHHQNYPCGAVYTAAIRNNNVIIPEEGNPEEPHNIMEQHVDEQPFDNDRNNIFLGIFDSNGRGRRASMHIKAHLFNELSRLARENDNHMSEDIINRAFSSVENTFMEYVKNTYQNDETRIEDGSCCIASIIWGRTLYIANLGDSRAVLGSNGSTFKTLHVEKLTNDHSVSNEAIREELQARNPYVPEVVLHNQLTWNTSNIKVNRSIGYAQFKNNPINSLQNIPEIEQIRQVLVSAEPELHSRKIRNGDRFLILASHGFWNFMTNEKAANIVNRNPRDEIAKRLLSAALEKATEKRRAERVYDDMIIIVLFFSEGLSQRIEEDTPKRVVLHEGSLYSSNIIMASRKSDQSHQIPTSSIRNPRACVPTLTKREGSSIGKEWDICLRSSEFRSDIHQSGQSDLMEIKKMLQEMQRRVFKIEQQLSEHQPYPPVSAIELEMIGNVVSMGFKVEVEKSIFGDLDKEYIYARDMIEVAKQDVLKNHCMLFYVRYLHEKIIRPRELLNKFSFLNPKLISEAVESPNELHAEKFCTIATVFSESQKFKDKLILAPCNLRRYWVLLVINVNAETIYYIDSLNSETANYPNPVAYFQNPFDEHIKKTVGLKSNKFNWIKPKCPKKPNYEDSGYYVMKFMKDIITSANEIPVNCLPDTYSNDDLDEVKTDWASYLINSIKTTKSSTSV